MDRTAFADLTDAETLALLLFGEARGESYGGQVAVAWVVRNRANARQWPDTVKAVALQPYQFSCFNPSDRNFPLLRSMAIHKSIPDVLLTLANRVLNGDIKDPTQGATNYHTVSIRPKWAGSLVYTVTIGAHKFYRLPGASHAVG
jgi:N-acetylmuramoyl-L-alanine amidase